MFRRNLRALAATQPSVAQVCRDTGINRTQFNRYLAGEAFPRPDVLDRICRHFGRDARILLEPLEDLDNERDTKSTELLNLASFARHAIDFDHKRVPDGLYLLHARSVLRPTNAFRLMMRLFTLSNGEVGVGWSMPVSFSRLAGESQRWRDRKSSGAAFQHTDGFTLLLTSRQTRSLWILYFRHGYGEMTDIHAGYAFATMRTGYGGPAIQPALLERIPRSWAEHMAARRRAGEFPLSEASHVYRHYLSEYDQWRRMGLPTPGQSD